MALCTFFAFVQAETLPGSTKNAVEDSSAVFRVDGIRYDIGDAFDDSKSHTKYDKWAFDLLNWIHIETREVTVRKLLLFDEGDSVDLNFILEAERFLRTQRFLSDASISMTQEDGRNVANVHTSDNWTLTIPVSFSFAGRKWTYDNLNYGIGVQESNFLGLGQLLGVYYGHDELRNMVKVEYGDPHFLIRYNQLDVLYSHNTDGFLASWNMYRPFLSRSFNQWAYTLEGLMSESFYYAYGSGDYPPGTVRYDKKKNLDDLPEYNGDTTVTLMKVEDYISDSLSFRLSRSFGNVQRKFYIGLTYDYRRMTAQYGELSRFVFKDKGVAYVLDSASVVNEWIPERKDSRLGFYLKYDNLRYDKIKNYHTVKWTEDISKGFSLDARVSKNYEQLGAADNDIRLDFNSALYLGHDWNHLTVASKMFFYLDHWKRRDFYGRVTGEYIFHPSNKFSTVLSGLVDFYKDARYGFQLSLDKNSGFAGFPTGIYTGQARVFANLEQRYFADVEVATLMPVLVAFGSVGETAWDFDDINRKDLVYVLGFGARFVQTKSISRFVNKLDVTFPINGARKGEPHFSITTTKEL